MGCMCKSKRGSSSKASAKSEIKSITEADGKVVVMYADNTFQTAEPNVVDNKVSSNAMAKKEIKNLVEGLDNLKAKYNELVDNIEDLKNTSDETTHRGFKSDFNPSKVN